MIILTDRISSKVTGLLSTFILISESSKLYILFKYNRCQIRLQTRKPPQNNHLTVSLLSLAPNLYTKRNHFQSLYILNNIFVQRIYLNTFAGEPNLLKARDDKLRRMDCFALTDASIWDLMIEIMMCIVTIRNKEN